MAFMEREAAGRDARNAVRVFYHAGDHVRVRVLLNCSTLVKGGALQVAASFIQTAMSTSDDIAWHYVISKNIAEELEQLGVASMSHSVSVVSPSPARNIQSRKILRKLAQDINPDIVFTLFGPAYVDFVQPHLCGVADGWVTHGDRWAWRTVQGPVNAVKLLGRILYKAVMFRKADAWVTETATAKEGMSNRLRIQKERITIIPNNCAKSYLRCETVTNVPSGGDNLRILCMAAYYRHKYLEIVPVVAKELRSIQPDLRFEFVMTLPGEGDGIRKVMSKARALGVDDRIVNAGYVPLGQGPDIYRACHMLFLPSVLETFSASYPEAMAMGVPIVTTNLSFARDVCGNAATYFEPMNARDAAGAIIRVLKDAKLWHFLITEGKKVLHALPTQEMKYEMYKNCIYALHRRNCDKIRNVTPAG
ncbi:glycosyltransferase family 4 protein [Nitrospira sp. KM1]|uniref:glycosyltransferase family 4 protein n=1 Tax=Nitrospira sp. KM1 TaxID=1936990 RepID=UPI001566753B|nr:glycosyltransferase [Nitrospira sp. KM1]